MGRRRAIYNGQRPTPAQPSEPGVCPLCGRDAGLTNTGTIRRHKDLTERRWCAGVGTRTTRPRATPTVDPAVLAAGLALAERTAPRD